MNVRLWALGAIVIAFLFLSCATASRGMSIPLLALLDTPTPLPTDTPTPTPTPPPTLKIEPDTLPQGGVAVLRVMSARRLSVSGSIDDRALSFARADKEYWTLTGLGATARVGVHPVRVTVTDEAGRSLALTGNVTVNDAHFPVEDLPIGGGEIPEEQQKQMQEDQEKLDSIYRVFSPQPLWKGLWAVPIEGETTSGFGWGRSYQGGPVTAVHQGIDTAANFGQEVPASQDGKVVFVGRLLLTGNTVVIDHGMGVYSNYFHFSSFNVQVGDEITKGQIIGYVGSTGFSTGPHLHWEMTVNGVAVDPLWMTTHLLGPSDKVNGANN